MIEKKATSVTSGKYERREVSTASFGSKSTAGKTVAYNVRSGSSGKVTTVKGSTSSGKE